ncbi:MAG: DUF4446 family protein [Ardenticatenaceae bacterium]
MDLNNLLQIYSTQLIFGILAILFMLLFWVVTLNWRLSRLHRRYRTAMAGTDGSDIESLLADQRLMLYEQAEQLSELQAQNEVLQQKMAIHAGAVGVVRFNPFQDTGGNQSFSVAWVNEQGNGVVISSLYTRAGTRLYAKPLQQGNSNYMLSEEEEQAMQIALAGQSSAESAIDKTDVLQLPPS